MLQDRSGLPEGIRFLLVGGLTAAGAWLVRFPLSAMMPYGVAVFSAGALAVLLSFPAYRALVFRPSRRAPAAQLRDFIAVNAVTTLVAAGVAMLLAAGLLHVISAALAEAVAHAGAIAFSAVLNFFGHRLVTFRQAAPLTESRRVEGALDLSHAPGRSAPG